jgi:hypothetical protein
VAEFNNVVSLYTPNVELLYPTVLTSLPDAEVENWESSCLTLGLDAFVVDQVTVVVQLLAPDEIVQLPAEMVPEVVPSAHLVPFQPVPEVQEAVAVAWSNKVLSL